MKALAQIKAAEEEVCIEGRILILRGQKVLLDRDLAGLYGVATKVLNQAVKRNLQRFPEDFMFQLTLEEGREVLRSQIVTIEIPEIPVKEGEAAEARGRHSKYAPNVFTELGVAMLSSVLGSERAILANISIMRTFVKLRHTQINHEELGQRLDKLEWRQGEQGEQIRAVFETIEHLMEAPAEAERKRIGFPMASASTTA